jgi:putative tryptophan/tyrosine transport system substrate-binding protein
MRRPINRRQCIAGLSGMAVAAPLVARAQPKLLVIGWLDIRPRVRTNPAAEALVDGLRDAGFVEGRNLIIEHRSADGRYDRLPALRGTGTRAG